MVHFSGGAFKHDGNSIGIFAEHNYPLGDGINYKDWSSGSLTA